MMSYVGIMVNDNLYRRIPLGKTGHEMLEFYEEAGKDYDLKPCFFRLKDIRKDQDGLHAYVKEAQGYVKKHIPLPCIIHNRSLFRKTVLKQKIEQLGQQGMTIFNGWNRYEKRFIHELLMKDFSIRPHLPCTVTADEQNLRQMMELFSSLIIKPNIGSIGRGIVKLDRTEHGWHLLLPQSLNRPPRILPFKHKLPPVLIKLLRSKAYIIQQRLDLATFHGRPFDLRVSVQRGEKGKWQVTGIAGKVAAPGRFVTNVAQGGQVFTLEALLSEYSYLNTQQVRNHLIHFSLKVAKQLSKHLLNLADVGLDVGLTDYGFPVFIECNGRDQRYSFADGHMPEQWKATYRNPIAYARYLADRAH